MAHSACHSAGDTTSRRVQADSPQTLFEGGLHLVFSFLDDEEWMRDQTWLACRKWYAAALSMRSRRMLATVWTSASDKVASLVASHLALHHVTRVTLCRNLKDSQAGSQETVEAVLTSPVLRDRLTEVRLSGWWDAYEPLDFTPLLQLPKLNTLDITGHAINAVQSESIRQLGSLVKLAICDERRQVLPALLSHSLHRLTHLKLHSSRIFINTMQFIVQCLPQLTCFEPDSISTECMSLLGQLTGLREVLLRFIVGSSFSSHVAPHLASLSQLRKLDLRRCNFERDEEVVQFLSAMPHLEDLSLGYLTLPGLTGFVAAESLVSLTLDHYLGVTFAAVCQLSRCPRLRRLELDASCANLTPDQIDELSPPSKRLPMLEHFVAHQ